MIQRWSLKPSPKLHFQASVECLYCHRGVLQCRCSTSWQCFAVRVLVHFAALEMHCTLICEIVAICYTHRTYAKTRLHIECHGDQFEGKFCDHRSDITMNSLFHGLSDVTWLLNACSIMSGWNFNLKFIPKEERRIPLLEFGELQRISLAFIRFWDLCLMVSVTQCSHKSIVIPF